jgi:predicted nucleic acid-binding protein
LLVIPSQPFGELLVTATVWHEVTREPRAAEKQALSAALGRGLLHVEEDPERMPPILVEMRLDEGERSALALGLARGAVVLVDERRGRACAAGVGLTVVGTLGLLVRARESGYFLAQPLIDRALAVVGE